MMVALLAAASATAGQGPVVIEQADWLRKPDLAQIQAVWPTKALHKGVSGSAELSCRVNTDGLLQHCAVTSESPQGMGFGAAALLLTPNFEMKPETRNGQPVESIVHIPIRFPSFGPGSAEGRKQLVVARPIWREAPSFADVAKAYPARAEGASGFVVLHCQVGRDDRLKDCDTLTVEPRGKGFEHAAEALAGRFRLVGIADRNKWAPDAYTSVRIRFVDPKGSDFQVRRIAEPTWTAVPSPAALAEAFPSAAAAKRVLAGHGVVQCTVDGHGGLSDCKPLSGEPEGLGFAEAAAKVATGLRMNPWTDDGGPVDGAVVDVPIRFNLVPAPTAPPSEAK